MAEGDGDEIGELAALAGRRLPVQVCKSAAGFFIGTADEEGLPFSRESTEYWQERIAAERAMSDGKWTQRRTP